MTTSFAPVFQNPSTRGQLSNKRASTAGGDAISITVRHLNPRGSIDPIGMVRFTATKVVNRGATSLAPQQIDDLWYGAPTLTPAPIPSLLGPSATVIYGGRVYVTDGTTILSSAITNQAVGTYRPEYVVPGGTGQIQSLTVVNGFLYATQAYQPAAAPSWGATRTWRLGWAKIAGDGSLGPFTFTPTQIIASSLGSVLVGYSDGSTYAWLAAIGQGVLEGRTSTSTRFFTLSLTDGSVTNGSGIGAAGTALPNTLSDHAVVYDPVLDRIVIAGGLLAAAATANTYYMGTPRAAALLGAWSTGQALPAVRAGGALQLNGSGTYYYIGGSPDTSFTGSATTYATTDTSGVAWAASTALAGNRFRPAAYFSQTELGLAGNWASSTSELYHNLAWISGQAAALVTGVVTNADGSQDWTVAYANASAPYVDGDQVQIAVQFTDVAGGDPSPVATTVVKIGQPPTISGFTPSGAVAGGRQAFAFAFNSGAGGGPEGSWQLVVKDAGAATVFDTGVRTDRINSGTVNPGPLLTNQAYSFALTVKSADVPMPGSSNSATVTNTVTPSAGAPAAPTAVTATPDHTNGLINLAWASVAATTWRVYYRRTGASAWRLLADNVATNAYVAMDQIALGVGYDFAVSAINATPQEGPMSAVAAATIQPGSGGGYTVMVHVAGNGVTYRVPLFTLGAPKVEAIFDVTFEEMLGLSAPAGRSGVLDYHKITFKARVFSAANQTALQQVIQQDLAGALLYYRSAAGDCITCVFDKQQTLAFFPKSFLLQREIDMTIIEQPNPYQPSVSQGSAGAIPTQQQGTVPALDLSETVL